MIRVDNMWYFIDYVVYTKFIINVDELYRVKTVLFASETLFLVADFGPVFRDDLP